ncbi:MAG TPA: hydrogenase nickel incorporation protein HypB [Candidatus Anammoximicrobium sp.]|nr:hydrogenase nickel incorporation protein HypB [Candidatus Anammoximicrobium sp.]
MMKIVAAKAILKANDQLAAENRERFTAAGVYGINLVGSPGCGKTTLLEGLFQRLQGRLTPAVIEGDIAGQVDAERMSKIGVPVVQINTDGMCHLDASMIAAAADSFGAEFGRIDTLWIENVGNLVCTAGYDLGEHLRIIALSVPEGDDKLVKYPAIFQRSQALVISKLDLLPYSNFDVSRVRGDMKRLAPEAEVFEVSALHGDGLDALADWLVQKRHEPKRGQDSFSVQPRKES